jgi:hypothetical protein
LQAAIQAAKRIARAQKVMDVVEDLFCFHVKLGACMTWQKNACTSNEKRALEPPKWKITGNNLPYTPDLHGAHRHMRHS